MKKISIKRIKRRTRLSVVISFCFVFSSLISLAETTGIVSSESQNIVKKIDSMGRVDQVMVFSDKNKIVAAENYGPVTGIVHDKISFSYDKWGRTTEKNYYDKDGTITRQDIYDVAKQRIKEIKMLDVSQKYYCLKKFNDEGKVFSVEYWKNDRKNTDSEKYIFRVDTYGPDGLKIMTSRQFGDSGALVKQTLFDEKGRMLKTQNFENTELRSEVFYTYDVKGDEKHIETYAKNGDIENDFHLRYNLVGQIQRMSLTYFISSDKKITETDIADRVYDDLGRILYSKIHIEEKTLFNVITREYDSEIIISGYDAKGRPVEKRINIHENGEVTFSTYVSPIPRLSSKKYLSDIYDIVTGHQNILQKASSDRKKTSSIQKARRNGGVNSDFWFNKD